MTRVLIAICIVAGALAPRDGLKTVPYNGPVGHGLNPGPEPASVGHSLQTVPTAPKNEDRPT
jgi:hypothetical protein